MSTTVVTRGKIEVYERSDKELPSGWAVDRDGRSARAPAPLLDDMFHRIGGGILPLGGMGETFGGHKGYGLAVMVDILCSVLCGAPFGPALSDTATSSARVSHFFGAIRIDHFREPAGFRRDMDQMLRDLRNTPVAEGAERVYFAGRKEMEMEQDCAQRGVPLVAKTWHQLQEIGETYGVELPPALRGVDL
jgi:LDH2 family malate/lactate/ureidoglycolate dehydrogenase